MNVVTIHLPSLRERRSDIPMLVQWFLDRYASDAKIEVTSSAMTCLLQYDWPGNVRELENCIERAIALGNREVIDVPDLPSPIRAFESQIKLGHATPAATDLEEIERETIQRVFEQVNGDKDMAGKLLGISRATLYRKIKRYNIVVQKVRSVAARA